MTVITSSRVRAPDLFPLAPGDGIDELAGLNPDGEFTRDTSVDFNPDGGLVGDGPDQGPAPYHKNSKKRILIGPKNNIWIGSLNVRTLKRSKLELANRLIANKVDIMGIQEHRLVHPEETRTEVLLGGARLVTGSAWRNGCGASVGGVGLMVSKLAYDSLSSVTPYGGRILKATFSGNPRLSIVVVYSPTEASTSEEAEEFHKNLRDVVCSTPAHDLLLVLGDLNAKLGPEVPGFTYNSRTNRNGSLLLDTMEECSLVATNLNFMRKREKRWTFLSEGTHHKALLDYILVRSKWRNSIKDTRVTNSFNSVGSDHRAVLSRVRLSLRKKKQQSKRVVYEMEPLRQDPDLREAYSVTVQNRFAALAVSESSATEKYQAFTDAVQAANKQHLKVRPKRKRTDLTRDPRIQAARSKLIAAKEDFHLDQTDRSRDSVNKAKDELSKAYIAAEEEEIESLVKEVEDTAAQGKHRASWKLVNELTGRGNAGSSRVSGSSAEERLESWRVHFSRLLGQPPSVPDEELVIERVSDRPLKIDDGPFTLEELNAARKQLKSGKAAGEDSINPEVIKYVDTGHILLDMCNDALLNRQVPDQWKRLNIMPVPKKGDLSKVENYRGIALSSVVAKTLNRMIRNRMTPAFEEILRPEQNGFRPGRSTSSHILGLRRILEGARARQLTAVLLFVDFRKAFDSLHRGLLMKILAAYGVPDRLVDLIDALYQDTVASVLTEDGPTELFNILAGVLQGDTLAPLLFIIAIDYIMRKTMAGEEFGFTLEPRRSRRYPAKKVSDADYADDLTLLADTIEEAQRFLGRLEESAASVGLHINNGKTKYMSTGLGSGHADIKASDGQPLEEVNDFVYLGAWIGNSEKDFEVRKAKAWGALNKMNKIWKSNMSRKTKVRLFRTTVETILLYGSEAWTVTKSLAKRLDGCYSRMLRAALNIRRSDKIPNSEVFRDLPRISEKVRTQRLKLAGHLERHKDLVGHQLLGWKPNHGHSRQGRPALTFPDVILQDLDGVCETMEEARKLMMDRDLWRTVVHSRPQQPP